MRLDGRPSILAQPLADTARAMAIDDHCVVTELGSTCLSSGEPAAAADAVSSSVWHDGPVARRVADTAEAARLTISADEQRLLSLSAEEARAALRQAEPAVRLSDAADNLNLNAPHLTELALAALYIFCFM